MIYTSYFARLKDLPDNITPIAICGAPPNWYKGFWYKALAPKYAFFAEWKKTHDNDYYTRCFQEQVLDKLNVLNVVSDLRWGFNAGKNEVALICYEKPGDFCHRHLVADWLNKNGFICEEYNFEKRSV